MGERAGAEPRYTAFLSYSHKDAAAAGRLHRRLEAYRLPKRLAGTETARGIVPERLWPIFRDREELPAATDLSETVREALALSGALIVLCSPHSAGSLWVAEEIETFRRLHPDRPILAAVLDGDPPDCFPAALRAFGQDGTWHEPLATDLRRGRDGAHLGLLKLVAGITGVGLDALVQRDALRKIRRVMAVTGAAVVAMLVMAALALVALNARREAERQRAEAEGLIEFMLSDLRRELRGVGRLDIMSIVNARALSYYDSQHVQASSPPGQAVRARVDHTMGEDLLTRGDMPAALLHFRRASQLTSSLIGAFADDPAIILVHAQSEYWIGRVHELRGEWPEAQRQYSRFARLTDRLIEMQPGNPDYMTQVGWAAVDLGNVQLNGRTDVSGARAAQRSYEKAVQWFTMATRARPRDSRSQLTLANAYAWLADSHYAQSEWEAALRARIAQHRILAPLYAQDRANFENGYRLALAEKAVGVMWAKVGNPGRARAFMLRAYDWSNRLRERDPFNAEWLTFGVLVRCEFYYRDLGFPPGMTREVLAEDIRSSARRLARPSQRSQPYEGCVAALQPVSD